MIYTYIHIYFYFLLFHVPLDPFILNYHISCVIFSGLLLRISQQKLSHHKKHATSLAPNHNDLTHILVVPGFNLVLKDALVIDVFRGIPKENIEFEATSKWARIFLLTTIPRQYHRLGQQISLNTLQIFN